MVSRYAKSLPQAAAIVLTFLVAASADSRFDDVEWIQFGVQVLSAVGVWYVANVPEYAERAKFVVAALSGGLSVLAASVTVGFEDLTTSVWLSALLTVVAAFATGVVANRGDAYARLAGEAPGGRVAGPPVV